PEYYPLTLNALTNACNQKSNREPVMQLDETDVLQALDVLRKHQLAHQSAEGIRAVKFCHNLAGRLNLDPEEMAVLTELLLRGPQTVGTLRSRAMRMCDVGDLQAIETLLQHLIDREDPLVVKLPRQPGRKDPRFMHLLAGEVRIDASPSAPAGPDTPPKTADARILQLEKDLVSLQNDLADLRRQLHDFKAQFD
ncbi:MAG: YceH family protein, partial [Desulfuromonadales bacterium]